MIHTQLWFKGSVAFSKSYLVKKLQKRACLQTQRMGQQWKNITKSIGMDMYTLLYLYIYPYWITNTAQGTVLNVMQMAGPSGGERIHVCVCLSPWTVRCPPETITTLLIGYTPT